MAVGEKALFRQAAQGNLGALKTAAEQTDILDVRSKEDRTLLHVAAASGSVECVSFLLTLGIPVEVRERHHLRTPLFDAAAEGQSESVLALIRAGARVDAQKTGGWTPLMAAASKGHYQTALTLLEANASLTAANLEGSAALHLAARNGCAELVRRILRFGPPDSLTGARNRNGKTALCIAAYNGHAEVVRTLIGEGAAIMITDKSGHTPLHEAVSQGHTDASRVLLDAASKGGCLRNLLVSKDTIVVGADAQCVRLLLDHGADKTATDLRGRSPRTLAALRGATHLLDILDA